MTVIVTTEAQVRTFLAGSTRPAGECLGTVGNDMTGHFGSYLHQPGSATEAANSLQATGELYTSSCPAGSHFDFYHFIEDGIDYGHIDFHVGALHYANSTRCTVWLNTTRTVGTYPSWPRKGESRRGWSYRPASLDTMPPLTGLTPAGGGESPLINRKGTNMSNLFHDLSTSPYLFALAGGSPGTPANWLETSDVGLATALSAQLGASSAGLTHGSFLAWKAAYLAPVVSAGGVAAPPQGGPAPAIDYAALAAAISTALAPSFGTIPGAVVAAQGAALSNG